MKIVRRRLIGVMASTVAGLAVCAVAQPPSASADGPQQPMFAGSCVFHEAQLRSQGSTFGPMPEFHRIKIVGPGLCTGTLNGSSVSQADTLMTLDFEGQSFCLSSDGPNHGVATFQIGDQSISANMPSLVFDDAKKFNLGFDIDITGASGRMRGTGVGSPFGSTVSSHPFDAAAGCAVHKMHGGAVDLSFTTESPLVSLPPPAAGAAPASAASSPACASRRKFAIQVRPTDRAIRSATVTVDGKRTPSRRTAHFPSSAGRRTATIDLTDYKKSTVTVITRATLRAKDGKGRNRVVRDVRHFKVCAGG